MHHRSLPLPSSSSSPLLSSPTSSVQVGPPGTTCSSAGTGTEGAGGFGKRGVGLRRRDRFCLASSPSCLGGGRSVDQPYLFLSVRASHRVVRLHADGTFLLMSWMPKRLRHERISLSHRRRCEDTIKRGKTTKETTRRASTEEGTNNTRLSPDRGPAIWKCISSFVLRTLVLLPVFLPSSQYERHGWSSYLPLDTK